MRFRYLIGIAYCFLGSGNALASELDPATLLTQCRASWMNNGFIGTMVYQHDHHLNTLAFEHTPEQSANQLHTLNGIFQQVLSTNWQIAINGSVIADQANNVPGESLNNRLAAMDVNQIQSVYAFSHQGFERASGRNAHVLLIEPKDEFRYTYRVLIDEETKLLLGASIMDVAGIPLEKSLFTQLSLKSPVAAASSNQTTYSQMTPVKLPEHWRLNDLPKGFMVLDARLLTLPNAAHQTQSVMLSDGIAMVSLFIEPKGQEVYQQAHRVGAMNAIALAKDNHQMYLVGDVPFITLETIASRWEYVND